MAEAILPGSISGGSSNGLWEHIGYFTNTSTAVRISNAPSMNAIASYVIVVFQLQILKTLTPDARTNIAIYLYGHDGGLRGSSTYPISAQTCLRSTMYRRSRIGNDGDGKGYYWIIDASDSYAWDPLTSNYAVDVRILSSGYPTFNASANSIAIDMYGIRDPFA